MGFCFLELSNCVLKKGLCKEGVVAGRAYEIHYVGGLKRADGSIRDLADSGGRFIVSSTVAVGRQSSPPILRPWS